MEVTYKNMLKSRENTNVLTAVEILNFDTAGSRLLYRGLGFNAEEKAKATILLKGHFERICAAHGGTFHDMAGDGACAFFISRQGKELGSSIRAGRDFLNELGDINAQTALALEKPTFNRQVRIAAHRGEIFLTSDAGTDSANPRDFDDFRKGEKKFAPHTDVLYLTEEVFRVLPASEKAKCENHMSVRYGEIRTKLFRYRRSPIRRTDDIFKHGDSIKQIGPAEWRYLRTQIVNHFRNTHARNLITKGLITYLDSAKPSRQPLLPAKLLLDLTLDAMFEYLKLAFERHPINLCFWRKIEKKGKPYLSKVAWRGVDGAKSTGRRETVASESRFKVCQAFGKCESIVTPSIASERLSKSWVDFPGLSKTEKSKRMSALQIPIYVENRQHSRKVLGVLSLDSDAPDVFLPEEILLWTDELVGFLANLSLAEQLRLSQEAR
ncbi:MAG: hypothetical protein ACKVQK_20790 [Burkholderiales bacterium]